MIPHVILIMVITALLGSYSFAETYVCHGFVRSVPCHAELSRQTSKVLTKPNSEYRESTRFSYNGLSQPEVSGVTFKRTGSQDGHWRGYVTGKGLLELQLEFLRQGASPPTVLERVFIGRIRLPARKTTWFNFKTRLPNLTNWSWRVVASALPG